MLKTAPLRARMLSWPCNINNVDRDDYYRLDRSTMCCTMCGYIPKAQHWPGWGDFPPWAFYPVLLHQQHPKLGAE